MSHRMRCTHVYVSRGMRGLSFFKMCLHHFTSETMPDEQQSTTPCPVFISMMMMMTSSVLVLPADRELTDHVIPNKRRWYFSLSTKNSFRVLQSTHQFTTTADLSVSTSIFGCPRVSKTGQTASQSSFYSHLSHYARIIYLRVKANKSILSLNR